MTQALRVALWVPTADPPDVGDSIATINPSKPTKAIDTKFALFSGGTGGGGGIGEAPSDGTPYARQDGGWVSMAVIDAGVF